MKASIRDWLAMMAGELGVEAADRQVELIPEGWTMQRSVTTDR